MSVKKSTSKPTYVSKSSNDTLRSPNKSNSPVSKLEMKKQNRNIKGHSSDYFTSVTPFSKLIAFILFISLPFIGFLIGYKMNEKMYDMQLTELDYTTLDNLDDELTNLDLNETYSTQEITSGAVTVYLTLSTPNGKEEIYNVQNPFICESREVMAIKGNFKITASTDASVTDIVGNAELGEQSFVYEPSDIEQNGKFSEKITLSQNPVVEATALSYRNSCDDSSLYLYSFNPNINKVVSIPFVRKDGTITSYIWNPKGESQVRMNAKGEVISSQKNLNGNGRNEIRYRFNVAEFRFEEV